MLSDKPSNIEPKSYLLDTNAYAMMFQDPTKPEFLSLKEKVNADGVLSFYIPEIVSMEIHSVIGKFRRGGSREQREQCDKHIVFEDSLLPCQHTCIFPERKRMNPRVFRALQKLMDDIEARRGVIQAAVLPVLASEIAVAKQLLKKYASYYAFGSHDAMVAGTLRVARENGVDLTLVTSDKALKAVCNDEKLPVYDPRLS